MRSLDLPINDEDGEPIRGVLPLVGDRYQLIGAVTWFTGWRAGDWDRPEDAADDWLPTPAEPAQRYDLGYAFAAAVALCWPDQSLPGATIEDWRRLRSGSAGQFSHVILFGELALESLVEAGIGQADIFAGGRRLHRTLAETVPDVGKVSRLADFSPVQPDTSISH